jgi:hypothetical protein
LNNLILSLTTVSISWLITLSKSQFIWELVPPPPFFK